MAERRDSNPRYRFSQYNGLANSRFHTLLLFGINKLGSDGMSYFGANDPCSAAIVQLLCNQKCDGFSDRFWSNLLRLRHPPFSLRLCQGILCVCGARLPSTVISNPI